MANGEELEGNVEDTESQYGVAGVVISQLKSKLQTDHWAWVWSITLMGGICNHFQSLRGHGARALGGDYGTDRNVSEGLLYLSLSIDFFGTQHKHFIL